MSKIVLGKGLEALIPSGASEAEQKSLRSIPVDKIAPNPMQPRHDFDEAALKELADSFKANGIIQPLVVKKEDAGYIIVAGERRYRAAKMAHVTEVPAVVLDDIDEIGMLELALVENLQRENLNAIEIAEAYRTLIDKVGLTQQELADKVGKSRVSVTNILRLLNLPEEIRRMIRQGKISEGHARAIMAVGSEEAMIKMAQRIVADSLSVREVEEAARPKRGRKLIPKRKLPEIAEVENELKQRLGTSVKISHGLKRGKIEIEYYGADDLDRLVDLFRRLGN